jgi:hypothetical protein
MNHQDHKSVKIEMLGGTLAIPKVQQTWTAQMSIRKKMICHAEQMIEK